MWNKWFAALLIILAIVSLSTLLRGPPTTRTEDHTNGATTASAAPMRIVSMAPSITEVLFALGQVERVVGVTQYCNYPPSALKLPRIGGFNDINYEVVVSLRPDLVVVLPSHRDARENLARLNIATHTVDQTTVENILQSITVLGELCDASQRAAKLTSELQSQIDFIRSRIVNEARPRTLVCVDRDRSSNAFNEVFIASGDGFYPDLLEIAGGVNAFQTDVPIKFPSLSREAILRLKPEVIFELVPELARKGWNVEDLRTHWDTLTSVDAVKNQRVHVLAGHHVSVPGPRITILLKAFASALHPEVDFSSP